MSEFELGDAHTFVVPTDVTEPKADAMITGEAIPRYRPDISQIDFKIK
jgi:hypothetical protein